MDVRGDELRRREPTCSCDSLGSPAIRQSRVPKREGPGAPSVVCESGETWPPATLGGRESDAWPPAIKTPFDSSVFSAAGAAFLPEFCEADRFALGKLLNGSRK